MPNNKDNPKSGSPGSMSDKPDREFEGQGQNKDFGGGKGQAAGGSQKSAGSPGNTDDDDTTTSGGREGQFSDKNRGNEGQWSPGSSQSSDQ